VRAGKRKTLSFGALAMLTFASAAHADFKEDYAHGVRAYEAGDYGAAQKFFQDALDAHAEPAARMRLYGQIFKPYVPQHYLGLIGLKRGDCATLRAQWGSSDNRQIMLQLPDIAAEEERDGAACSGAIAKTEQKPVAPAVEKPAEVTPPKAVVIAPTPKPAAPPKPPPVVEKPPVEKPVVAEKIAPPDALVQAFDQFLAGHYADVARINPDAYADTRARFHAYLVRAAARYTQARLTPDEAMLAGAKADAAAARALDARTSPDATLFSPMFREFYATAK
jgi:hypothetical protein